MKRNLFSSKSYAVMSYFRHRLTDSTYWCRDMMKMLVYLADWEASITLGHQITDLVWKTRGCEKLEAGSLEGLEHWEWYLNPPSLLERVRIFFGLDGQQLSEEEKEVLDAVIDTKTSDEFRVGSLPFRKMVFSTWPFLGSKDLGSAPLPELVKDYTETSGDTNLTKIKPLQPST